jgi:hypothetical protein
MTFAGGAARTEARGSFLKKRTKRLLFTAEFGNAVATTHRNQSFFASFCSQKEVLALSVRSNKSHDQ